MKAKFSKKYSVKKEHSAAKIGSGALEVLSTPSMIAFMENAAYELCQENIEDTNSETTVGISLEVKHLKASAISSQIEVKIIDIKQDNKILSLVIEAYQDDQLIGQANHQRAVVNIERFMSKLK
ncbi:thioesterase family protein [Facklamia sp. 7083-14-GEN3]|uniref:thioesterase family protein n=1 Tax=Facklamia sp. 7083-14-GEN3 TaxID=2973478 RepID=UPI00215BCFF3|nr:thioesterase family protein [Facklamia sp. 7083-14-GEN3]MCR8969211.1 thioesterase family protein [Facklamia sp. 7083-14-GEN3]